MAAPAGRSRLRILPERGTAIVVSDLHGHHGDWRAFLSASRAFERIAAGEDVWVVITGDAPDVARHRMVDSTVPEDGDVRILDDILRARRELGPRGERIVYLEGNHDFHVSRIVREAARHQAAQSGGQAPRDDEVPEVELRAIEAYCAHYRASFGEAVYQNNVAPYDMVRRVRREHLAFLEEGPIVCHMPVAGVVVTHAGPPRMAAWRAAALRREIERACRERMRDATPEAYYGSPYHQLLNNRFRNGDYGLDDVRAFLAIYGASVLVTGHTPHPYLVDLERRVPLDGCAFREGLGVIGGAQIILCTSFGAFSPALKRYLEVDLARPLRDVEDLVRNGGSRPLYPDGAPVGARELPGLEAMSAANEGPGD